MRKSYESFFVSEGKCNARFGLPMLLPSLKVLPGCDILLIGRFEPGISSTAKFNPQGRVVFKTPLTMRTRLNPQVTDLIPASDE